MKSISCFWSNFCLQFHDDNPWSAAWTSLQYIQLLTGVFFYSTPTVYESLQACSVSRLAFPHTLIVKQLCCGAVQQGSCTLVLLCVICSLRLGFLCAAEPLQQGPAMLTGSAVPQTEVRRVVRGGKSSTMQSGVNCAAGWVIGTAVITQTPLCTLFPL